jgi:hypothetical protein
MSGPPDDGVERYGVAWFSSPAPEELLPNPRELLIHNERTKLLAAAVDRASTAFLTVGIATPVAGRLYNVTRDLPMSYYVAAMAVFGGISVLAHMVARHILGGLR